MQFHTVTSNLIPACRPLQSEPLATKLFLYVPSIYLSPSSKFNSNDFDNLITQLPPPILLLGDFNAHSSLRGCSRTDIRGKLVEDLLLKHNLSLLNDGSYTYLHPATGSSSAIDLSIAIRSLYLDFSWQWPLPYWCPLLYYCTPSAPGSYLKPTGPPFRRKLLQIWEEIIPMIWKILSSISLISLQT